MIVEKAGGLAAQFASDCASKLHLNTPETGSPSKERVAGWVLGSINKNKLQMYQDAQMIYAVINDEVTKLKATGGVVSISAVPDSFKHLCKDVVKSAAPQGAVRGDFVCDGDFAVSGRESAAGGAGCPSIVQLSQLLRQEMQSRWPAIESDATGDPKFAKHFFKMLPHLKKYAPRSNLTETDVIAYLEYVVGLDPAAVRKWRHARDVLRALAGQFRRTQLPNGLQEAVAHPLGLGADGGELSLIPLAKAACSAVQRCARNIIAVLLYDAPQGTNVDRRWRSEFQQRVAAAAELIPTAEPADE